MKKETRRTGVTSAAGVVEQDASAEAPARVLRQFRQIFNAFRSHFRRVEHHVGIGGAQLWALSVIKANPGIGMNALARAMDVRQPTASNLVKSLAMQGLVEVRKEGADRRAVQLHALAAGSRLLRRAPGPIAGILPDALANLDAPVLSRLERDLGILLSAIEADRRPGR